MYSNDSFFAALDRLIDTCNSYSLVMFVCFWEPTSKYSSSESVERLEVVFFPTRTAFEEKRAAIAIWE
eukprot:Awhi_evm1s5094